MPDTDAILFGWTLDEKGGGRRLFAEETAEEIRNAGLSWVHLNASDDSAREWLQKEAAYLDDIILDALLADETRPRTLDYGTGMVLILRGVNTNPDSEPEDMVSLRLWVDEERIISIERRRVETIRYIDGLLSKGSGPRNAGDFLSLLTGRLFEHLDEAIGRRHDQLDALEETIQTKPDNTLRQQALDIRRAAIMFRRYVAPQRDVLAHLRFSEKTWIFDGHRRGFQEDLDQVLRTTEDLDLMRERAQISYESLNGLLAQRVNKNLYFLSGIATIFMPLTFITGLFGMNVDGIPYAHHSFSFMIICIVTIGLAALQALIFKWLKWF